MGETFVTFRKLSRHLLLYREAFLCVFSFPILPAKNCHTHSMLYNIGTALYSTVLSTYPHDSDNFPPLSHSLILSEGPIWTPSPLPTTCESKKKPLVCMIVYFLTEIFIISLQRCSPPSLVLSLSPGLGPDGLPSPGGYHLGGAEGGASHHHHHHQFHHGGVGGRRGRGSPVCTASELMQLAMRSSTGKKISTIPPPDYVLRALKPLTHYWNLEPMTAHSFVT